MWLALGVVLAVACVLFVARPFLRDPAPKSDRLDEPGPQDEIRVALAEERDRALSALKELEFDHRTGKISDEDYRALVGPLRRRAAAALRALDGKPTEKEDDMKQIEAPEPFPSPEPEPAPVPVPEPSPVPSEPPGPVVVPEPGPEPSPPARAQ
ncbi:MAG TPA: hypothetical protein VMG74_03415 [Gaiellaceae bacterium]|nr:hypothetical protein [Gaiellaceae bacterium]